MFRGGMGGEEGKFCRCLKTVRLLLLYMRAAWRRRRDKQPGGPLTSEGGAGTPYHSVHVVRGGRRRRSRKIEALGTGFGANGRFRTVHSAALSPVPDCYLPRPTCSDVNGRHRTWFTDSLLDGIVW